MSFDLNNVTARLVELGEDWADKDSAASFLEDTKTVLLAELKNGSMAKSDAAKEMEAKANPHYKDHIVSMADARRVANIAKVNYDAAKVWSSLLQTQESTKRAEMKFS